MIPESTTPERTTASTPTQSVSLSRLVRGRFRAATATTLALLVALSVLPMDRASGAGDNNYQRVSFQVLKRYKPGKQVPAEIESLNGKNVEVLGFMAALTQLEGIEEFVLSSAPPLNCYCAPPLFINEVISVKMNNRKKVSFIGGVVKVRGRLIVNTNIRDEFTDVMYTLRADAVQ